MVMAETAREFGATGVVEAMLELTEEVRRGKTRRITTQRYAIA